MWEWFIIIVPKKSLDSSNPTPTWEIHVQTLKFHGSSSFWAGKIIHFLRTTKTNLWLLSCFIRGIPSNKPLLSHDLLLCLPHMGQQHSVPDPWMRPKVLTPLLIATRIQATVGNMGIEWCDFSEDMGSITNIFCKYLRIMKHGWLGNPTIWRFTVWKIIELNGSRCSVAMSTAWDIHFSILACPKLGISKKCSLIQLLLNHMDILKNNHMINPHAILNHPKPADLLIPYGTVVFFLQTCFIGTLVPDGFEFVLNMLEWDSRPQAAMCIYIQYRYIIYIYIYSIQYIYIRYTIYIYTSLCIYIHHYIHIYIYIIILNIRLHQVLHCVSWWKISRGNSHRLSKKYHQFWSIEATRPHACG